MENLFSRSRRWLTTLALCILSAMSTTALADEVITFAASELIEKAGVAKTTAKGCNVKVAMAKILQDAATESRDGFAKYGQYGAGFTISAGNPIHKVEIVGGYFGYNNYCSFSESDTYSMQSVEDDETSTVTTTVTPTASDCKSVELTSFSALYVKSITITVAESVNPDTGGEGGDVTPVLPTSTFDFSIGAPTTTKYYSSGAVIAAPDSKVVLKLKEIEDKFGVGHRNTGDLCLQKNVTFSIAAPEGAKITKITFRGKQYLDKITASGLANNVWTGEAQEVTFTANSRWDPIKITTIEVECIGDINTPDVDPEQPAAGDFKYTTLVSGTSKTILDTDKIHEVVTFDGTVTLVQIVISEDWDGNKTYADPKFQILDESGNKIDDTQAKASGKTLVADFGPLDAGKYFLSLAKGAYAVGGVVSTKELRLPYTVTSTKPQITAGQLHYTTMTSGEQHDLNIKSDVITFDADVTLDASKTFTIDGKAVASAQAMGKNVIVQFGTTLALGIHTLRIPAGAVTVNNVYNEAEIAITYNITDPDHSAIFDFTKGDEKWISSTGSISVTGRQGTKLGQQAGLFVFRDYSGSNYTATFTAANGCTIESITFDNSYAMTASTGNLSGAQWTGSAQTVTFTATELVYSYCLIQSATVIFSGTPAAIEYTVHITGDVPADASVTVAGKPVADGTKVQTFATLTDDDVEAEYDDYIVTVDVAATDITVNYTNAGTTTFRFDTVDFGTTKNGITVKAGGAFNENFGALQLTTGRTLTFTAPEGYKISRIDFIASSNSNYGINFDAEKGTYAGGAWTGLEKAVTLTSTYISHVAKAIVTIEEFVPPTPFAPTNFTVNYGQDITNGGSADYAVGSIEVRYGNLLVFTNETPAGVTLTRNGEAVPFTSFTTGYTVGDEVISYFGIRPAEQIVLPGTYRLSIPEGVLVNADDADHVNAAVDFEFVVPVLDEYDYEKDGKYDTKDVKALQDMILAPVTVDEYGYPHGSYHSVGDLTKFINVLRQMAK